MEARRRFAGVLDHLCHQPSPASAAAAATIPPEPNIDEIVPLAPRTHTRADDPPGSTELGLSPEEIDHFKTHGFIVKRGLVEPALAAGFVDTCWENAPGAIRPTHLAGAKNAFFCALLY
jgi:hypothetical protein